MKANSWFLLIFCLLDCALLSSCASSGDGSQQPPPLSYSIGGMVVNLAGNDLQLQNNGGDTLTVNADGVFTFAKQLASGSTYSVTVHTQPSNPAQTCSVTKGTGTASSDVKSVLVDCGKNEWAWMSGANTANASAVYGTQGVSAPGNVPGARFLGTGWADTMGNLWLFGGEGVDSAGVWGYLNDLWMYNGGEWTWVSGSDAVNQSGTYGMLGIATPGNSPGARRYAATWTDSTGNFWLFGGEGYDSVGTLGYLNDLWKYNAGQWTWISGSNTVNQTGNYGALGVPAPDNVPGARRQPLTWSDPTGNLWFFGGDAYDSEGSEGVINDLWEYSQGHWTWISGAKVINQVGTYGTEGTPAVGNIPGARWKTTGWIDNSGNLWLFGGSGHDSTAFNVGYLNDLWRFSGGQWTWVSGSNLVYQGGICGTKGTPAPLNIPGAREAATSWSDSNGNLWLLGGDGDDCFRAGGGQYPLNDLWRYSGGQWTWMSGSDRAFDRGQYGTLGIAAPGNNPSARYSAVGWTDADKNFWVFSGWGTDSTGAQGALNDLWRYEP